MARTTLAALLAAALSLAAAGAAPATAAEGLGLGVIVGEPTGLSLKSWLGGGRAVAAAAAWSFSGRDALQLHADYLLHDFSLLRPPELRGAMPVFYGVGARVKLRESGGGRDDEAVLGLRIPVGVAYEFDDAPVEVFAEIVPVLDLAPDTDFDLNAAVGARYYFR